MTATDTLHVIHPRAAGLDIHKMQITATARLCGPGAEARSETREFSALPYGLEELVDWLRARQVSAATMEATGVYWTAPFQALEEAGIEATLVHAQHSKNCDSQRKTSYAG